MKKLVLMLLVSTFVFTLAACEKDETPDGVDCEVFPTHKDCKPPESECYAPGDYSETLTYELVWSDEFDGDTLNEDNWRYEINGNGGGNQELQYYTGDNTEVSDGTLKIIARKEEYLGRQYTSSRITTQNNATFKYGIFEASIKIPAGTGTWPAFWMMPQVNNYGIWPRSGEIDIMEHVGYNENHIHGTIHTRLYNGQIGTQKGGETTDYQDVTTEFHVYKIEWLPDRIKWFVDDELYYTYQPNRYTSCADQDQWPFNEEFFMILNVAIGGTWGGAQGVDDTIFPVQMEIDYVRVYQATELENYDDHRE